jgi:hypothetical protein
MAILNDTEECEEKAQLIKGLKKTGIYQVNLIIYRLYGRMINNTFVQVVYMSM